MGAAIVAGRRAMNGPSPSPRAGGLPIALGTMAGAIGGALAGQATIGVLAGFAVGTVVAIVIWRRDR